MTSVRSFSLCLLFFGGWNLAAAEDENRCVAPIYCDGKMGWIETSKLQPTCPKHCESCAEEVKKAKDVIDEMMCRTNDKVENLRKKAEQLTTDMSRTTPTALTKQTTTIKQTTASEQITKETTLKKTTEVTTANKSTAAVTTAEKTTTEVTAADKSTTVVTTADKSTTEVTTAGESTTEVTTAGKSTTEVTTAGESTTEVTTAGESTTEVTTADKITTEVTTAGKSTTVVTTADKSTTEVTTANKSTTEVTTAGKSTTEATTPSTAKNCTDLSGFQWNGKCFWVNVTDPLAINYAGAAEICADHNARPANIYNNNTHYNQVMTYLRPKIPVRRTWMYIWLGMTYNSSTEVLSLYNGTMTSNQVKWWPGLPSSNPGWTQMGVRVNKDPSSTNQGMWNWPPSSNIIQGVICEIDE